MWSRPIARLLLRRLVYPAMEDLWATGFAAAGWLWRRGARSGHHGTLNSKIKNQESRFARGERVGILAPHPDDETAGCGGVAALHHAAGHRVSVLVLTDGGASRATRLSGGALIARRADEARAAAEVLGVDALALAGLPEGAWALPAGAAVIARWLAEERPTLLYAPSGVDYHPEHLRAAQALAAALRTLPPALQPTIRVYEVFVPLGPGLVNRVAAIGPVQAIKASALACYRSQAAGLAQVARRERYLGRYYGLPCAAEGFCAMPAAGYGALMARSSWPAGGTPYRGLRPRPITDPLAYLAGASARRRLHRALDDHA